MLITLSIYLFIRVIESIFTIEKKLICALDNYIYLLSKLSTQVERRATDIDLLDSQGSVGSGILPILSREYARVSRTSVRD